VDDGGRLWVNGKMLADSWKDQAPTEYSGQIALTAGQKVDIKFEHYQAGGGQAVKLLWSSPSEPKDIIPKTQLFPAVVQDAPTAVAAGGGDKKEQPGTPPAPAAAPANLLDNGDFELGNLTGWMVNGGDVKPVEEGAHEGAVAVRMTGANGMSLAQAISAKVAPGTTYVVTAWVKIVSTGGSSGIPRLRVCKEADLNKADFGEAAAQAAQTNEWQKLQVTCTFTADDLAAGVFVGVRHVGFQGTDLVDDVSVLPQAAGDEKK
jgi:hypothetical protein